MNKREITNQELDNLFRDALEQPPIINEEQVNSLLYDLPKAHKGSQAKQFFKKQQNLWIMSTIISSIIVGTVLWTSSHFQHEKPLKNELVGQINLITPNKTKASLKNSPAKSISYIALPDDKGNWELPEVEGIKDSLPQMTFFPSIPYKKVNISKDRVIRLSLDDFKKIGFVFTDSSVSFINLSKDSVWCYFKRIGNWQKERSGLATYTLLPTAKGVQKKEISYHDYHPWFTSGSPTFTGSIVTNLKRSKDNFSIADSLIPIALDIKDIQKHFDFTAVTDKQSYLLNQGIFWFNLTPELYSLLPDSVRDTAIGLYNFALSKGYKNKANINVNLADTKVNADDSVKISSSIANALVLSEKELTSLGFVFQDSGTEYRFKLPEINPLFSSPPTYIRFYSKRKEFGVGIYHDDELGSVIDTVIKFKNFSYYPEIISDSKGRSSVSWGVQHSIKRTTINTVDSTIQQFGGIYYKLQNRVNYLIPVLVKRKPGQLSDNDLYFWFTPTDEFFAALPERYAKEIRNDYNIIKVKQDPNVTEAQKAQLTSSCKYFDECKTTLFDVNFNIWPNPTNDVINFELKLKSPERLSITVQSITGSRLLNLQPMMRFEAGNHTLNFSLASLKPGIYLVSVQNEKGEFTTQRVIRE